MDEPAPAEPARPAPLVRHVLEVVAPAIDMERLRALLTSGFDATSVSLRTTVDLGERERPLEVRVGRLGKRILEVLRDGKPWRAKHLVAAVAEGRAAGTVRRELDLLWEGGLIAKPRSGVWMLAGLPAPAPEEIPRLRAERAGGPTVKRVLERLHEPTAANVLVEELGVTRQRVDQVLKGLQEDGKVVRFAEQGTAGRWVWVRSDVKLRDAVRRHQPALAGKKAVVLGALEPDAFHSLLDVAEATGSKVPGLGRVVDELSSLGLVASFRLGQRRYVGITPRGLEHPGREAGGSRAAVADMSRSFGPRRIAFLETLSVLGEARTIEVTAALAGEDMPGQGLMSGQLIAGMLQSEFAERVERDGREHPRYRLTEAGRLAAALVARTRPPPRREEVEARIAAYTERRRERLQGKAASSDRPGGAASPAQAAILEALRDGPLPARDLAAVAARFVRNPKSSNLMLKTLEERGVIRAVGKDGQSRVWALAGAPERTETAAPAQASLDV